MKTLTVTLLLCAGLTAATAAQAQPPHTTVPTAQYKRNLYGDWSVSYPAPAAKTADQVNAELAQSKADGQYSFGQEDYPPAIASNGPGKAAPRSGRTCGSPRCKGRWHPARKATRPSRWPIAARPTSNNRDAPQSAVRPDSSYNACTHPPPAASRGPAAARRPTPPRMPAFRAAGRPIRRR